MSRPFDEYSKAISAPMAVETAKYSCDECRSRKIKCSREVNGCSQCATDSRKCVYSRSGVLRRRPKGSIQKPSPPERKLSITGARPLQPLAPRTVDPRSQLDEGIDEIQSSLQQFGESENDATGSLTTLGKEYSSVWQGPSLLEMAKELNVEEKKFLSFTDEQANLFTDTCLSIQRKGRPFFSSTPISILRDILSNPNSVAEKAHMVLVYGILLTNACLDGSTYDERTTMKLRWNLRLALDDAKLLLEPSDLNIQALILLACHVQEVSTPSLCWMMISTACRMLQVMGVNSRSLDSETRDRRQLQFWLLNGIDKTLALVFGRPPTLHRTMCAKMTSIPLQKMLDYQPHISTPEGEQEFKSMFGAHLMRQTHVLSIILSDIWVCLFEDGQSFDKVRSDLEEWWTHTESLLQACLLAEKSFLDTAAVTSMELGIRTMTFHYHYLSVLLTRTRPELREQCVSSSQEALLLLEDLVSDSSEVYNGIIWMLLYCPFTPFFILLGDVLGKEETVSKQRSLQAMERMSTFLLKMRNMHPQAAKLQPIAATLVQYAKNAPSRAHTERDTQQRPKEIRLSSTTMDATKEESTPTSTIETETIPTPEHTSHETANQQPLVDLFNDPSVQALSMNMDFWLQNSQSLGRHGVDIEPMMDVKTPSNDPYGFFADSTFDWFSWDPSSANPFGL